MSIGDASMGAALSDEQMPGAGGSASPDRGNVPVLDRRGRWDLPMRICHVLLIVLLAAAVISPGESALHEMSGTVIAAVVLFRIIWGFVGTGNARFKTLFRRQPHSAERTVPAGILTVLMILVLAMVSITGIMQATYSYFGVNWVTSLHTWAAMALGVLITAHVVHALVVRARRRDSSMWRMFSFGRSADPQDSTSSARPDAAAAIGDEIRISEGLLILALMAGSALLYGWFVTSMRVSLDSDKLQQTIPEAPRGTVPRQPSRPPGRANEPAR